MKIYIETQLLISAAKYDECSLPKEAFTSDLAIAEIHNIDEPERTWVAQLLENNYIPCLKVNKEEFEFARKYVYNHIINPKDFCLGVHYAIAAKVQAKLFSNDERFSLLKEEFNRINQHFGWPITKVEVAKCSTTETNLQKVREMINRLFETQGSVRTVAAVKESVEFFTREKKLNLKRVEKI